MKIEQNVEINIREVMVEKFYSEGITPAEVRVAFKLGTVKDDEGLNYWKVSDSTLQASIDPLILKEVESIFGEESVNWTGAVMEVKAPGEYKLILIRLGYEY